MEQKQLMIVLLLVIIVIVVIAVVMMGGGSGGVGVTAEGEIWCQPGENWAWAGPYQDAQVVIKGMEIHNGVPMCHGQFTQQSAGGMIIVDVWWDETGSNVDYAMQGGTI